MGTGVPLDSWPAGSSSPGSFATLVGESLSETFVRSINTSLMVLIMVVTLAIVGPASTRLFATVLAIGMFFGTYSSIFIAPPVLAQLREKEPAMQALAKRVNARSGAVTATTATASVDAINGRGPRNQPKRKGRK